MANVNYSVLVNSFTDTTNESRLNNFLKYQKEQGYWKGLIGDRANIFTNLQTFNPVLDTVKKFHLKGIQWGQWVSMPDRLDYLIMIYYSLLDMNKVLKFKNDNLGLDKSLVIAIGSRGVKGALAHYEHWSDTINITRYKKAIGRYKNLTKQERFAATGGSGSFAHEYGHFLDDWFNKYTLTQSPTGGTSTYITGGRYSGLLMPKAKKGGDTKLVGLMNDIMKAIIFKRGGVKSEYYLKLEDFSKKRYDNYLIRRNELFARAFEQYISIKLSKLKIKNAFLAQLKYSTFWYMSDQQFKKVEPKIDKLVKYLRTFF